MSNNIGILKAQLQTLERSAEALERVVYSELTAIETMPEDLAEEHRARVLRKLESLDELQDDIDEVGARLKALGAFYGSAPASMLIYEYKPPRVPENFLARAARMGGMPTKTAWDSFRETLGPDNLFTFADIVARLDTSEKACRSKVQHWRNKGYLETAEKTGSQVVYRALV
jgi:hypothetical protein